MNNRRKENMKQIGRLFLLSSCASAIGGAGALALANGNVTEHFGFSDFEANKDRSPHCLFRKSLRATGSTPAANVDAAI
jgi:hypothetical protein